MIVGLSDLEFRFDFEWHFGGHFFCSIFFLTPFNHLVVLGKRARGSLQCRVFDLFAVSIQASAQHGSFFILVNRWLFFLTTAVVLQCI